MRLLKINLMKNHLTPLLLLLIITLPSGYLFGQSVIDLKLIGRYSSNVYDAGGTEIAAYDAVTSHLFSVNAATGALDIIDLSDPSNPVLVSSIDLSPYGAAANSVASMNGIVAAAVEDTNKQENGRAVFFDAAGNYLNQVEVGALPDMLTFTPDGMKVLVANEGEPNSDYTVDPVGSVSIIDLSGGIAGLSQANVTTLDFSAYNNTILDPSIRVYGPNATVAQDMEPEYIAVSGNSEKAYVTLQENNALGVINLKNNKIVSLIGLGFKDYMDVNNKLDASDQNSAIVNITNWPVYGMYQPDAIKHIRLNGNNYLVTANEGDVREYSAFAEGSRVASLLLDETAFPDALNLKNNNNLGRLNVTKTLGDSDNDGDYDALYAFGARSFSIRSTSGSLVFDSGDKLETFLYEKYPLNFNCSNTNNTLKNRSDDKGPEPEGIEVAEIFDSTYAFVGLERTGGVVVYNITDPLNPRLVNYVNTRDLSQTPGLNSGGDLGPEGLLFIPAAESPNGRNLLVVSNEISGTIAIFETDVLCATYKVQVCYDGETYCVGKKQLPSLLQLGAVIGPCEAEERNNTPSSSVNLNGHFLYPNPTTGAFQLKLPAPVNGNATINIYNMMGSVVWSASFTSTDISIFDVDASMLNSGLYFYSVNTLSGDYNGKVVISK